MSMSAEGRRIRAERLKIRKKMRRLQDNLICLLDSAYGNRARYPNFENTYIDPDVPVTINELKTAIYPNFETEFKDIIIDLRARGFTCQRTSTKAEQPKPKARTPRKTYKEGPGGQYQLFGCHKR